MNQFADPKKVETDAQSGALAGAEIGARPAQTPAAAPVPTFLMKDTQTVYEKLQDSLLWKPGTGQPDAVFMKDAAAQARLKGWLDDKGQTGTRSKVLDSLTDIAMEWRVTQGQTVSPTIRGEALKMLASYDAPRARANVEKFLQSLEQRVTAEDSSPALRQEALGTIATFSRSRGAADAAALVKKVPDLAEPTYKFLMMLDRDPRVTAPADKAAIAAARGAIETDHPILTRKIKLFDSAEPYIAKAGQKLSDGAGALSADLQRFLKDTAEVAKSGKAAAAYLASGALFDVSSNRGAFMNTSEMNSEYELKK